MLSLDFTVINDLYVLHGSLRAVSRILGTDHNTIKRYMMKSGLNFKPRVRYYCNEDFFQIINEKSSYWAGFIAADGCVRKKNNSFTLTLTLASKDINHLNIFRSDLNCEHPIRNYTYDGNERSQIVIYSEKISQDLTKYCIVPRKTKILKFPQLDDQFVHHFMRGYFDGDGSLSIDKRNGQLRFNARGTSVFLAEYRKILEDRCCLRKNNRDIRIDNGIGIIEYSGNNVVKKICNFLYDEADTFLDRKHKIAYGT